MPNAQGQRLRIAYVVGAFPDLSETFVERQIVGVAARDHIVDIYTTWDSTVRHVSGDVERHGLLKRVRRLVAPAQDPFFHTLSLLLATGWRAPMVLARVLATMVRDRFSGSLRLLYAALVLVRAGRPRYDVIHAQFGPFGVLALKLVRAGAMQGPIVTSFRGYDAGVYLRANSASYAELFREGALFLPVSRTLAARLVQAGCDSARVRVHHSGVAYRRLRFRESRPTGDRVRLITVARLVEKKGVAYALQAIAQVVASGRRVFYTVIGDGPMRPHLEHLIWECGLEAHVRLAGAKPHDTVLDMINAAHILIAPSITAADGDEEGIPNAAKEAMAIGLPVIATRHGGIPELVEDGLSGYLVPERNADVLAARLIQLIDHPERWSAFGKAGRTRIERDYDIDRLNDELVALYREVAAGRLAARPLSDAAAAVASTSSARRH